MMGNLVSVIIPLYNNEAYINECLDSVLAQTYKNIEIIVIDDFSSDQSMTIIKSYPEYNSIRLFQNLKNLGVSSTRNRGIKEAKGEFIAFLDSDDTWLPEKIKIQMEFLEQNPEIGFTNCGGYIFGNEKGEFKSLQNKVIPDLKLNFFYKCIIPAPMSCILVRKELFEKVGWFDEELNYAEDRDMIFRLLEITSFQTIQSYLVNIRHHAKNSSKSNVQKYLFSYKRFLQRYFVKTPVKYKNHWFVAMSKLYADASGQNASEENFFLSVRQLIIAFLYNPIIGFKSNFYIKLFKRICGLEPSIKKKSISV
jgi:glycosyltransferase involved in cell wall biosynthesis